MALVTDAEKALLNEPLPWLRSGGGQDGKPTFYREREGSGEVVLLLHGLGASSAGWRAIFAGLEKTARIIAWDAPGFGGSAPLAESQCDEFGHADALRAFCDGLGIRKAHIVGSSWGGSLAVSFAKRYPNLVESLTLLAPNRCFAWIPEADQGAIKQQLLDPAFLVHAPKSNFLATLIAPDSEPLVAERAFALTDQLTQVGYRDAVEMMFQTDTLQNAGGVRVPTIILAGELDLLAPIDDHALPIAQAIEGAELRRVPGCGHLLEVENPQTVIAVIAEQLAVNRPAT